MERHVYYGFSDWADVCSNFSTPLTKEPTLVYALYVLPSCEGDATVVFKDEDGWKLASGSHCSCFGLEGQWQPEAFDPVAHLEAVKSGKVIARMEDYERDHPSTTQQAFDEWLAEAVSTSTV